MRIYGFGAFQPFGNIFFASSSEIVAAEDRAVGTHPAEADCRVLEKVLELAPVALGVGERLMLFGDLGGQADHAHDGAPVLRERT